MAGYTTAEKLIGGISCFIAIAIVYFIPFFDVNVVGVCIWSLFWILWMHIESILFGGKASDVQPTMSRFIELSIGIQVTIYMNITYKDMITNRNIVSYFGTFLTIFGLLMCIYCRRYLGNAFKGRIIVDNKTHNLVTDGPYGIVRHPIYSWAVVATFGCMLCTQWHWISMLFAGMHCYRMCIYKLKKEEALLSKTYGKTYKKYKQETPSKLIPLLY
eukprot:529353_1